ncbi:carboxypeptidase A metalloprotease [Chloropicon primus]|uniref:Carboxypeptidase A metalloprotease n=1 Tax=Chloropicon primus TaxID=1764295 RepID=A0A5B8MFK5_9CHLO|nr:carboxypeptidase A metalloprotease [Chloropicon primus]UPQ97315.1 carboxypeptidase A metalloprotease [Chloropicon primus]|mmetsp:Transcript_13540/g.38086  ORF Transcript_13540/g.38086 Transcript_13540/m.38086 type:complete len:528 (+) Transcript_13540:737-2320(+)|eukprot:QDZ18102.1 carboxypeptidase A metalloprotease [Chloropicon primus]
MRSGTSSQRLVGTLLVLNLLVATCSGESAVPLPTDSERWTYWSNDQIGEFVRQMQAKNPKHCKAYNVGQSVLGKQMWSLTVSTKPDAFPRPGVSPSSLSPSFLFIGGVHGDEPVGRQLMIYLAEELCLGAGRSDADPEIGAILAGGTVHLLFAMNPDGFDLRKRGNANDVDLNRNFPDPIKEPRFPELTGKEEPETIALMNYIDLLGNSLVGATHLHGGALVMVVPFDGNRDGTRSPNPTPDNELYLYLAKRYVEVQPEMAASTGIGADEGLFQNGIIQGSSWYPLWGGLQDFFYLKNKVYFTTVEMSDNKWPSQSTLPSLWSQHRPSMYAYMKAHLEQGLTVQVDFPPGSKEESVLVRMLNPEMGSPVEFRSKTTHSVHYPVPAGNYSLRVEWRSQEVSEGVTLAGEVRPGERTTLRAEKPSEPPTSAGGGARGGGAAAPRGEGAQSRMRRGGSGKGGVAVSAVENTSTTPGPNEPKPTMFPYVKLFSGIVIMGLPCLGYRYRSSFARGRASRSHLRSRRGLSHVV